MRVILWKKTAEKREIHIPEALYEKNRDHAIIEFDMPRF